MELSNENSSIIPKQHSPIREVKYISQKDPALEHDSLNLSGMNIGKGSQQIQREMYKDKTTQTLKNAFSGEIEEKVFQLKRDLMNIEQLIYQCDNVERREMLLDRGLVLSAYLNELSKKHNITLNDMKKTNAKYIMANTKISNPSVTNNSIVINELRFNPELLNQKYWTEKKIDRYEKTEERQKIPSEFWYRLKGKNFSRELHKSFALATGNFKENYKWLFKS